MSEPILNPATFGVPYAAYRLPSIDCQGQRSGIELLQPAFGMLSDGCWPEQTLKRHLLRAPARKRSDSTDLKVDSIG